MKSMSKIDHNFRQLGMAIVYQAVKDYCYHATTNAERRVILKDLRSPYMDFISDGVSLLAAEQLEKNPHEIAQRINQQEDIIYGT